VHRNVIFVTFVEYLNVIKCIENRSLTARETGGTCTFIFRKKHKSDTRCTSLLIPIAHYSVILRTVSSHIRLRG